MFFTLLGCFFFLEGGSQGGWGTTCLCSFPASAAQKWKFLKLIFFTSTIHNDQISHVKHVLDPIHMFFFTVFGCLDRGKGLGHNLLMQFFTLGTSKMEIFKTDFCCVLTIHNDQISYVKHALDPLHVFFTVFECWPPPPLKQNSAYGSQGHLCLFSQPD